MPVSRWCDWQLQARPSFTEVDDNAFAPSTQAGAKRLERGAFGSASIGIRGLRVHV